MVHGLSQRDAAALRRTGSRYSIFAESITACLLPILLYTTDPLGRPTLGPPREGPQTEEFLRTAYQDIPMVIPAIRDFWMPQRLKQADRQA